VVCTLREITGKRRLTAAGANAVSDAQAIAQATGVRLVRVFVDKLNHTQVNRSIWIPLVLCKPVMGCSNRARRGFD